MAKDSKWQIKQRTVRKFNDRKEDNLQKHRNKMEDTEYVTW